MKVAPIVDATSAWASSIILRDRTLCYFHSGVLASIIDDALPLVGRVFSTLGTVTTLSTLLATFLSGYVSSTLLQGVIVHLPTGELNAMNLLHIGAGVLIFVGGLHASRQFRRLR